MRFIRARRGKHAFAKSAYILVLVDMGSDNLFFNWKTNLYRVLRFNIPRFVSPLQNLKYVNTFCRLVSSFTVTPSRSGSAAASR